LGGGHILLINSCEGEGEMSMEYCEECDRMIDLDMDEHYVHFEQKYNQQKKDIIHIKKKKEENQI